MVPLGGLIDVEAERTRLGKEVQKKEQDLNRLEAKLKDQNFATKAPREVVAKVRNKAEETRAALTTLQAQLDSLNTL